MGGWYRPDLVQGDSLLQERHRAQREILRLRARLKILTDRREGPKHIPAVIVSLHLCNGPAQTALDRVIAQRRSTKPSVRGGKVFLFSKTVNAKHKGPGHIQKNNLELIDETHRRKSLPESRLRGKQGIKKEAGWAPFLLRSYTAPKVGTVLI